MLQTSQNPFSTRFSDFCSTDTKIILFKNAIIVDIDHNESCWETEFYYWVAKWWRSLNFLLWSTKFSEGFIRVSDRNQIFY